jgi:hypothetical protein
LAAIGGDATLDPQVPGPIIGIGDMGRTSIILVRIHQQEKRPRFLAMKFGDEISTRPLDRLI